MGFYMIAPVGLSTRMNRETSRVMVTAVVPLRWLSRRLKMWAFFQDPKNKAIGHRTHWRRKPKRIRTRDVGKFRDEGQRPAFRPS